MKYDENYVCNNSSKIIRFGKKLIHSLFCIIRVCSEKKESSILLGPKIVLYYYKHFSSFETCCCWKTCEAMENWKRSCNVMDLAMKLGVFFSYSLLLFAEREVLHTTLGVLYNFTFFLSFFWFKLSGSNS